MLQNSWSMTKVNRSVLETKQKQPQRKIFFERFHSKTPKTFISILYQ